MNQLFSYPEVSIIVPVYNAERYLRQCIDYLLNQKYPHKKIELIMVDNCSTDGSKEIIRAEKKIKYVYCERRGPSAARNEGIKHATGQIILLIDADCLADPELLLRHVKSHFYFQMVDPSVKLIGGGIGGKNKNYWALCDDYCSWHSNHPDLESRYVSSYPTANLSFLREIVDDLRFDEELFSGEDYDFCIRATRKGYRIFFKPEAKVYHHNRASLNEFMKHSKNWTISEYKLRKKGIITVKNSLTFVYIYIALITFASMLKNILSNSLKTRRYTVFFCLPFIIVNKAYLCYNLFKADLKFKNTCKKLVLDVGDKTI